MSKKVKSTTKRGVNRINLFQFKSTKIPVVVCLAVLFTILMFSPALVQAQQQDREFISMKQRLEQVIGIINSTESCQAAATAIGLGMETLYGGLRPVPSRDRLEDTIQADRNIADMERGFAYALQQFIASKRCPEVAGMALDLKLFVEQMNEVAVAVGRITRNCGVGKPCDDIVPMLVEKDGHEKIDQVVGPLRPGFAVKLRSPFVPWNTSLGWEEDVMVTDPIPLGQCVAVFKETRGLMLRLRLVRIDVVRDPWATPMLARGTKIPIFALEWVPSQYGKTWSICNVRGRGLVTNVTQRIKQDIPLNYFWRYYGSTKHYKKK